METRYVLARLRACEERLKRVAETLDIVDQEDAETTTSEYLLGYARGLAEGQALVRRLREALASMDERRPT